MPIEVTEDLLHAIATKEKALSDGRTLSKKGAFRNLCRSDDGTLLWGECQGSGKKPYLLSVDLIGDHPTIRCSCPVKPPPCKHTLGLLVHFLQQTARFSVAEVPAELAAKRGKLLERAEKRAEAASRPKEINKSAREKKTRQQREALDLLETLVLDVASAGLGTLDPKKAKRLAEQARQLHDAYLPGAATALRRLAGLATPSRPRRGEEQDEPFDELREPGDDLPDDQRHRLMLRHLTRLWAMVRKGQKHLDERLEEGESQSDADSVVEDLLGRVWELADLKAGGYARQDLTLIELAYERYDDRIREERVEQSFLVELSDGSVLADQRFRPFQALGRIPEKESFEKALTISEAGVYPGFVNRRVRWELSAYKTRELTRADWARLHEVAAPALDAALARYKEQIKNPLAPDEAAVLVRAADVLRCEAGLVLVDAKGARLLLRDSPLARCRSTNNLAMAAAAALEGGRLLQPASLLVRLYLGLDDGAVYGQPLALVVGHDHIRLGM